MERGRTVRKSRELQRRKLLEKKKRKMKKYMIQGMIGFFSIIGIIASIHFVYEIVSKSVGEKTAFSNETMKKQDETQGIKKQTGIKSSVKQKGVTGKNSEAKKIYDKNPSLLVLVNKDHILTETYQTGLQDICNGRLQVSDVIHEDLSEMLSDAGKEGYAYWIASAYRSRERQQELIDQDVNTFMQNGMSYEQALNKTYEETMPAGYSEHETGLALDILCSDHPNMDASQENLLGNQWLQNNCWKYGFILRYPKDKVKITKINYEPWHFRYVGKKAAKFMNENHLTLEEFYNLKEN